MEAANPRFLANIQDEPTNILQPIAGYEREPLLSLEDACQPLYSLVDNLAQYIWISKQNCKCPDDNLTVDESASIHLYTMEWTESEQSLYAKLNRALRGVNRQELKPWFRYLKLFLTALFKLPSVEGVVWRGVHGDLSSQYQHQNEQAWWAVSSCTLSLKVLESPLYLGKNGMRTLFSIETRTGRRIRSHSYFKHEEEILLLPGTFFQIISHLSPAEDLHLIHLKEISAPFPLLQPPFPGAEVRGKRREKLRSEIIERPLRRLINFADLNEKFEKNHQLGDIPNGYSNLRWHNASFMHRNHALTHVKCQGTGYQHVFQNQSNRNSSSYVALNSCGKSMIIRCLNDHRQQDDEEESFTSISTMTVHRVIMQAASDDGLKIVLFGFKSNVKLFKKKVQLFIQKPTEIQLDWTNIDSITFESASDDDDDDDGSGKKRFHFILISIEIT